MAEGCPQSPLLFLFIGEPLTRMLENDERLKGVTIGEHEHKVGQFADDTAAMLEGYQHLKKLFEIVSKWERATGMACNRSKTALIPMGSTRKEEIPEELLRELDLPKPSEEPYEIYLGAPVASDKSIYKEFLKEKYRATKSKMASWKLNQYTQKGRAMIANTLVSSRLRYWAQFMLIPRSINKSLDADIQDLSGTRK